MSFLTAVVATLVLAAGAPGFSSMFPHPALSVVENIGSSEEVSCLVPDGDGLWVGLLGGGVARWDGHRVERFDSADGLPGNRVNACARGVGGLWVATDSGLARLDERSMVFDTVAVGRFLGVAAGPGGMLASTGHGELLRFVCPGSTGADGRPEKCRKQVVQRELPVALSLAASSDGTWGLGGIDGSLVLSNGLTVPLDGPVLDVKAIADGRFSALTPDSLHEIVPGPVPPTTRKRRLSEYLDADGIPLTVPLSPGVSGAPGAAAWAAPVAHGSPKALVTRVARWGAGVAVGTDSGLFVSAGPAAAGSDAAVGVEPVALGGCPCGPRISSVEVFQGHLWAGGFDGGLCRLDKTGWTRFAGPDYLPSDMVNRLEATRRFLFVATLKGLVTVDTRGHFRRYVEADCVDNLRGPCPWHQSVPGVALDPTDATVWVADAGAIHNIRGNRWKHYFRKAGVDTTEITRIAAGRDFIVAATLDSGLLVKGRRERTFRVLDERHGLSDNWVMDVTVAEDGAVWAATCTRGVSRWKDGRWTTFTRQEGLADDYTLSVNEIDGRMWVGTLKGLTVLSSAGVVSLSSRDGLPGDEIHDAVAMGNRVWLATDGGLSAVRYSL